MLDAYVSGVAGRAVLKRGETYCFLDVECPDQVNPTTYRAASWLLADANDILLVKNTTEAEARKQLLSNWRRDRALRMVQITFQADDDLSTDAASALDEFLEDASVGEWLCWQTYAMPWAVHLSAPRLEAVTAHSTRAKKFLSDLCAAQREIIQVRKAWDGIADSIFHERTRRAEFELAAINSGTFFDFVCATRGTLDFQTALLNAYTRLRSLPNYREIINSWTSAWKINDKRKSLAKRARDNSYIRDDEHGEWDSDIKSTYANVVQQKEGVIAQLKEGNPALARKFASELIRLQVAADNHEFAAKSLCSLAQEARLMGHVDLQLEWLQDAIEICPTDGWTHGQIGDAYLALFRFDKAATSYELAGKYGDAQFALTGHARLLRAQGDLDGALQEFALAMERFPEHPEAYRSWSGYGEVLRQMWRLDEALALFEKALDKFQTQPSIWCGKAAVYRDIGRLSEAIALYEKAIDRFPGDPVPISGYADTLKLTGQFDQALGVYDRACKDYPDSEVIACGRADVLRSMRRFDLAKEGYLAAQQHFPTSPTPFGGYAETLRDEGELNGALNAYEVAVERFPLDEWSRNGHANMLRVVGRFADALNAFDRNVREFPFDSFSLAGRASLLKELSRYEDAIDAYKEVIDRLPNYEMARYGLASVYAIMNDFPHAFSLLPNTVPNTRASWIGYHIKGMALLRRGSYTVALDLFKWGAANTPFYAERRFFEAGVALANIRLNDFHAATVHASRTDGPVSNIILLHSFAELGNREKANAAFEAIESNSPPAIIVLRDELAAKFRLRHGQRKHDDKWIRDAEAEVLLQAA